MKGTILTAGAAVIWITFAALLWQSHEFKSRQREVLELARKAHESGVGLELIGQLRPTTDSPQDAIAILQERVALHDRLLLGLLGKTHALIQPDRVPTRRDSVVDGEVADVLMVRDIGNEPSAAQRECDATMGSTMIDSIKNGFHTYCDPHARPDGPSTSIQCAEIPTKSARSPAPVLCRARHAMIDFSKMNTRGSQRRVHPGAFLGDCTLSRRPSLPHERSGVLGLSNIESISVERADETRAQCQREARTTLVVSHDDIGNTYHSLADIVGAFASLAVASVDPRTVQLLNVDHRIMCSGGTDWKGETVERLDCIGPYFPVYEAWLFDGNATAVDGKPPSKIRRAGEFGSSTVCFDDVIWFAPDIGDALVWDGFRDSKQRETCTSSLFQSFGLFTRLQMERMSALLGLDTAESRDKETSGVRVLQIVREVKPFSTGRPGRRIFNRNELFDAIEKLDNVTHARKLDLATLPFAKQVAEIAQTDVLVGMHGAGLANIPYLPCGAVVLELRPHHGTGAVETGVETMAIRLGVGYRSWKSKSDSDAREEGGSIFVNLDDFIPVMEDAVQFAAERKRTMC
eukprot:m.760959 g.760959  ORF g.760959 m.760959 type:complete len:575 (-) comp23204_c1_seq12:3556-5280(-)